MVLLGDHAYNIAANHEKDVDSNIVETGSKHWIDCRRRKFSNRILKVRPDNQ